MYQVRYVCKVRVYSNNSLQSSSLKLSPKNWPSSVSKEFTLQSLSALNSIDRATLLIPVKIKRMYQVRYVCKVRVYSNNSLQSSSLKLSPKNWPSSVSKEFTLQSLSALNSIDRATLLIPVKIKRMYQVRYVCKVRVYSNNSLQSSSLKLSTKNWPLYNMKTHR